MKTRVCPCWNVLHCVAYLSLIIPCHSLPSPLKVSETKSASRFPEPSQSCYLSIHTFPPAKIPPPPWYPLLGLRKKVLHPLLLYPDFYQSIFYLHSCLPHETLSSSRKEILSNLSWYLQFPEPNPGSFYRAHYAKPFSKCFIQLTHFILITTL